MRYTLSALVLTAAVAAAPVAQAQSQVPRDGVEQAHDRQQLRQDGRAARDDAGDAARIVALLDRFDIAARGRDHSGLDAVDRDLKVYVGGELFESEVQSATARREVLQDRRESRSDRREIQDNRQATAPAVQRAGDRHDLRDDRRDQRDDRRDAAGERSELAVKQSIRDELALLKGRYDDASLARKRALIVRLVGLAGGEVRRDGTEKREDRKELREDRREKREDVRQG